VLQEKSKQKFPFNTQVQEKLAENDFWVVVKTLIGDIFRVVSGKEGPGIYCIVIYRICN
jgi:hypothetical protein